MYIRIFFVSIFFFSILATSLVQLFSHLQCVDCLFVSAIYQRSFMIDSFTDQQPTPYYTITRYLDSNCSDPVPNVAITEAECDDPRALRCQGREDSRVSTHCRGDAYFTPVTPPVHHG